MFGYTYATLPTIPSRIDDNSVVHDVEAVSGSAGSCSVRLATLVKRQIQKRAADPHLAALTNRADHA